MLAASVAGSKVPPDDLQTAPILTFTTAAAHELGKHEAASVADTNPAKSAQQNTAGEESSLVPVSVVVPQPDLSFFPHLQGAIARIRFPELLNIPRTEAQPCSDKRRLDWQGERHRQNQRHTCRGKNQAGREDEPPERWINLQAS